MQEVFDEAVDVGRRLEGYGLFLELGGQLGCRLASQGLSQCSDVALDPQRELLKPRLYGVGERSSSRVFVLTLLIIAYRILSLAWGGCFSSPPLLKWI